MQRIVNTLLALFATTTAAATYAQNVSRPAARMEGSPRISPGASGKITIHAHPSEEAGTLPVLSGMAELIVNGTVILSEPSIALDPNRPHMIRTHARIAVNDVIKGEIPGDTRFLVLSQPGGTFDGVEATAPDQPLVKSGERYVLFLSRSRHPVEAASRDDDVVVFLTTSAWAGLVAVRDEKIRFQSRTAKGIREYDGYGVDEFVSEVRDIVSGRFIPSNSRRLPLHPGPPDRFPPDPPSSR